jgi:hypothetical protein
VILLEANELLLDQHTTSVVKVVSRHVCEVHQAIPAHPPVLLSLPLRVAVAGDAEHHDHIHPEHTFAQELEILVVIRRIERPIPLEVVLVGVHVFLELDGVLTRDDFRVLVIVGDEVVDFGLVVVSGVSEGSASNGSTILSGQATFVHAEVVNIEQLSLLFQFGLALCCIAIGGRSSNWRVTTTIAKVNPCNLVPLGFVYLTICIGILPHHQVVVSA